MDTNTERAKLGYGGSAGENLLWIAKLEQERTDQFGIVVVWMFVALAGFGFAWWIWPSGVMDMPLASLTLWMLARAMVSAMSASVTALLLATIWMKA